MLSEHPAQSVAADEPAGTANAMRTVAEPRSSSRVVGVIVGFLVLGIGAWWMISTTNQPAPAVAWGFARTELLDQSVSADQYWENLAVGMDDWATQEPADRAALRQQFAEFRQQYQRLFALPHQPLTPTDRVWLEAKLIEWDKTFDGRGKDIETPVLPLEHVKRQVAMSFRKIGQQLRNRGTAPAASPGDLSDMEAETKE